MNSGDDEPTLMDALLRFGRQDAARFHIPGHKGNSKLLPMFGRYAEVDFTELEPTGNLYEGTGPIAAAEKRMAAAVGAPQSFFITGGSTQGICAALSAVYAGKKRRGLLCARNCHKSVYHAIAALRLTPYYVYPPVDEDFGVACGIDAESALRVLDDHPDIEAAIVTSPTYYGMMTDIPRVAAKLRERGKLLIVDEAHGAHLPYMEGSAGAVAMGAQLSVCSMHKTLPSPGQTALLCASQEWEPMEIRYHLSLYGTSSPSYPLMAAMDACRAYMEKEGRAAYAAAAAATEQMEKTINKSGPFRALTAQNRQKDPLRLVIHTANAGMDGRAAAAKLASDYGIYVEMADPANIVLVVTGADLPENMKRLAEGIAGLEKYTITGYTKNRTIPMEFRPPVQAYTPGEAADKEAEFIRLGDAYSRIAAQTLAPYPPGIPVAVPGERLDDEHLACLLHNGFSPESRIRCIKQ